MALKDLIEEMTIDKHVQIEQLPEIELYMDQVIQLFEMTFNDLKREEKEKIMTKTMINNYAKGGLLSPSRNKRYTKAHVMVISLIYEMKGALSLKDIQRTLSQAEITEFQDPHAVRSLYEDYLKSALSNTEEVKHRMQDQAAALEEEFSEKISDPYVQQVLLILTFVHQSNLYRRAAEKLIDTLP